MEGQGDIFDGNVRVSDYPNRAVVQVPNPRDRRNGSSLASTRWTYVVRRCTQGTAGTINGNSTHHERRGLFRWTEPSSLPPLEKRSVVRHLSLFAPPPRVKLQSR